MGRRKLPSIPPASSTYTASFGAPVGVVPAPVAGGGLSQSLGSVAGGGLGSGAGSVAVPQPTMSGWAPSTAGTSIFGTQPTGSMTSSQVIGGFGGTLFGGTPSVSMSTSLPSTSVYQPSMYPPTSSLQQPATSLFSRQLGPYSSSILNQTLQSQHSELFQPLPKSGRSTPSQPSTSTVMASSLFSQVSTTSTQTPVGQPPIFGPTVGVGQSSGFQGMQAFTGLSTQSPGLRSQAGSALGSLQDLSRPGSACSMMSMPGRGTYDPAIIPGAPIQSQQTQKAKQTSLRPVSTITQHKHKLSYQAKIPNTLARVLLKKELKEALLKRRETLEACEIEANQRQYIVHKMLVTGLLPQTREDDLPRVIPCLLPIELINGARVIRPPTSSVAVQKDEPPAPALPRFRPAMTDRMTSYTGYHPNGYQTAGTSTSTQPMHQPIHADHQKRSIGVQSGDPRDQPSTSVDAYQQMNGFGAAQPQHSRLYEKTVERSRGYLPSTSLRNQMEVERAHRRELQRTEDTQTESREERDQRDRHRDYGRRDNLYKSDDLLEATRRYFEDYDRQLQQMTADLNQDRRRAHSDERRRPPRQLMFSNDDPSSREHRRLELVDELQRRRDRISSLGALNERLDDEMDINYPDRRYGSLPRLNYGTGATTHRARDFSYRADRVTAGGEPPYTNYGSLPRHYERYLAEDGEPIQTDTEQAFGATSRSRPGTDYGYLSRSMHDLNTVPNREYTFNQQLPYSQGRSVGLLDTVGYDQDRLLTMQPGYRRDQVLMNRDSYGIRSQEAPPIGTSYGAAQQTGRSDMISQYANYLHRQFADQQSYGNQYGRATGYSNQPMSDPLRPDLQTSMPAPMPTLRRYDGPMSDPYTSTHQVAPTTSYPGETTLAYQQGPSYETAAGAGYGQIHTGYSTGILDAQNRVPGACAYATQPTRYDSALQQQQQQLQQLQQQQNILQQQQQYQQGLDYQQPALNQVYSRNETNYGARPLNQVSLDYGNIDRNRQLGIATSSRQYPAATYSQRQSYPQQPSSYPGTGGFTASQPVYGQPTGYQQGYDRYPATVPTAPTSGPRSWSKGNLVPSSYEAHYPRDDALSRVYATAGRRRPPTVTQGVNDQRPYKSLGRASRRTEERRAERTQIRRLAGTHRSPSQGHVKRILLSRRYKHHNVYNDIGLRVVGGKKMENGELGAFVSAVNQSKHSQTLGEVKEGDQVLEWNGVLLSGKTFEEVERIINSSQGEIEVIIKSTCPPSCPIHSNYDTAEQHYDTLPNARDLSPDAAPPVPAHSSVNGYNNNNDNDNIEPINGYRTREAYPVNGARQKGYRSNNDNSQDSLGHLQLAVNFERATSRLIVRVLSARGLKLRESDRQNRLPNPFVKIYLLPGRKVSHKRRTRFVPSCIDPEWNQLIEYDVPSTALQNHYLELSIWDYDKFTENNAMGQVIVPLNDRNVLSGVSRWYPVQACDRVSASRHQINAPIERSSCYGGYGNYNYNPASLDIGYPAIN